ncbi:MAG: response regulator receiver protein [uncultured bacterium]|nr:MAG: response regulator receiver protein [uncultured bacterium]
MAKTRKIKVLVVDNESVFASALADHLSLRKFEAGSVCSGEEALALVPRFHPDVIILDLQMPDMSGLDVLAQVKALDRSIEVILLTGNGSFDIGIACMQLGAFDYLVKPVDLDQIVGVITEAYRKKMADQEK